MEAIAAAIARNIQYSRNGRQQKDRNARPVAEKIVIAGKQKMYP